MSKDDAREVPRLITDAERRRLKSATFNQVCAVGGGDAFEPSTRVKQAALSNYGNKAVPEKFIPIDVAVELDRLAGAPLLIGAAAAMLGYRLEAVDSCRPAQISLTDAHAVAKETGEVVNLLLSLLSSGKELNEADRRAVIKEATEAKAAIYQLIMNIIGGSE